MSLPRAVGLTVYDLYQIEHANDIRIAYLALEGSHIYNTNIDHVSDTDFLAVIEPDARDILLQRADVNISAHSDYDHHDVRIWTPYTVMSSLQKSAMDIISILKADNVYLTHGPIGEFMKQITEHVMISSPSKQPYVRTKAQNMRSTKSSGMLRATHTGLLNNWRSPCGNPI